MKLSTKGRYGMKAIVDLAIHYSDEPVPIKNISERQNISECYLEQLLVILRKANLICSIRGAQGGYKLSRAPEFITVKEILDVLEGPVEISSCLEESTCKNLDSCATRLLWAKIKESIENVLKSTTLQDIVDDYKKLNNKRGI